ncbi:MAG: spiro-SPASM protein [Treponema sp.]|jgi:spiro-SPASM protein|nr:spiro-SPASM protein [Treponema sp.]
MRAITFLYGGALAQEAFTALNSGANAVMLAVEKASQFPGTEKIVFLGIEGKEYAGLIESEKFSIIRIPSWSKKSLLEQLSLNAREGNSASAYDLCYFAWADCPFLDPALASALADRHLRYAAEYSYADGWPYGFAPELLAPGTAGLLHRILGDDDGKVERDALFSILQKDINAFDIETEISPVDLRFHRLTLAADSKRNLLLISRFMKAGLQCAADAADLIEKQPAILRTLPAFFNIQVSGGCPQTCSLCPWPQYGSRGNVPVTEAKSFMSRPHFETLLDNISGFSGGAVISLSLWGELSLHPEKMELIKAVLSRPGLSLIIETSGIGWKTEELEAAAEAALSAPVRENSLLGVPLSWVISLDAHASARYREVRGPGFAEATETAKKLLNLFPGNAYVQAVRIKDFEDDIEQFYHFWKEAAALAPPAKNTGSHVIIQKYDDFCGALPRLQASDLSPVKRSPCWHNMRDMVILLDGSVPVCREDLAALNGNGACLGNAFTDTLAGIWERGEKLYLEQAGNKYSGICAVCDEFYTYNF